MPLRDDLIALGLKLPDNFGDELDAWAGRVGATPMKSTAALVGLSTVLFFLAERKRNPKVQDIWDSLVYCTTNLSVGFSDIFAKTPIGKIIGSALMVLGPSLAAKATDGAGAGPSGAVQAETLETLKKILARLEGTGETQPRSGDGR
ncbi:MAG: ion channel [Phycisphaerae bacterium]|nr:ion channel [Tepidisphaeraceae bacterium]